jgi:hypothetical protein
MYKCVTTQVDLSLTDLYTGSWPPSHIDLCHFKISQCNVTWRSFVQAGGSGCKSFTYSWWFFSAKCGSRVSARFLIYGSRAVCFLPLVAILDLSISRFWCVQVTWLWSCSQISHTCWSCAAQAMSHQQEHGKYGNNEVGNVNLFMSFLTLHSSDYGFHVNQLFLICL